MRERPILFSAPMVRQLPPTGPKTQTRRVVNESTLRVRLGHTVTSDPSDSPLIKKLRAKAGTYRAKMNQHGAVSIFLGGSWLGVKPGEFDFVCPYVEGKTHLADHGEGRKLWTIIPDAEQLLWVRETWGLHAYHDESDWNRESVAHLAGDDILSRWTVAFAADWGPNQEGCFWRPSIHLPKWATRIWLEVTGVRVERLQDITEEDAKAEGVELRELEGIGDDQPLACDLRRRTKATHPYTLGFAVLWDTINEDSLMWKDNPWVWVVEFKRAERKAVAA